MEVHKELGCGFLEPVYQEALEREFSAQEIPFKSQPIVEILYKGTPLTKKYQPDYTDDGGHLNERGRKIVAEQLLIFLSNLCE